MIEDLPFKVFFYHGDSASDFPSGFRDGIVLSGLRKDCEKMLYSRNWMAALSRRKAFGISNERFTWK